MIGQVFRGVLLLCFLQGPLSPQSRPSVPFDFQSEFARGQTDRQRDHLISAVQHFHSAAEIGAKTHDPQSEAKALLYASGLEIRLFRYQAALESANSSKRLALTVQDKTLAGAATSNVASVYSQLGVNVLAEQAAQEAIGLLLNSDRKDYLVRAMINAGDCQFELKQASDIETLRNAVRLSRQGPGLKQVEALALDHLGQVLFEHGDIAEAAKTLNEARTLKTELHDKSLAVTDFTLAQLALKREDFQGALRTLDRALASGGDSLSDLPAFWVPQLRGEILEGLGNKSEALVSLRRAANLADNWRLSALPGDLAGTQTVVSLDSVYRDFVELSAELALERHDPSLARQALTVLAKSRATDLREQMIAAFRHQMQLPPRYFELLAQLQTSEATLLGASPKQIPLLAASLRRTRDQLSELQNQIGISYSPALRPKSDERNLLMNVQRSLGPNQLLLSFSLGKKKSFLWGVSNDRLELYQLPAEGALASRAAIYFAALQQGTVSQEGAELSRDLLGQLAPALAAKRDWLIAADGVLLDQVPFAALPAIDGQNPAGTLIDSHSLRFLPSELLLINQKPLQPAARFIGVADPIYNRADSRLGTGASMQSVRENRPKAVTLARLFGSGAEVRAAAKLSGLSSTQLLTGIDATEAKLRVALHEPPSVLHFAVHVFNSSSSEKWRTLEGAGDEALALSLTPNGIPELLTKEAVAGLRTPGALVVLSGCSSQQGQIVPSAGLMGLSRAWLLAGAAAVIVTSWPTPDDSGGFFSVFYRHLKAMELRTGNTIQSASMALQQTQVDMQNTSDYRKMPSFWAAYSIISAQ